MTTRSAYAWLLIPALVWCAGFLLLPLTGPVGDALAGEVYGRVCHQLEDRSVVWADVPWAVCVRCSTIYLAFTLTLILVPLLRGLERWTPLTPRVFAVWLAPAVLDAALNFSGLHVADMTTRALTGALAGVGLGVTIPPLFFDALTRSRRTRTTLTTGDPDVR
jgi:uncharacterized membrane protein